MNPGRRNLPAPLITRAPAGIAVVAAGPIATMYSPRTTTVSLALGCAPVAGMTVTFRMASTPRVWSVVDCLLLGPPIVLAPVIHNGPTATATTNMASSNVSFEVLIIGFSLKVLTPPLVSYYHYARLP